MTGFDLNQWPDIGRRRLGSDARNVRLGRLSRDTRLHLGELLCIGLCERHAGRLEHWNQLVQRQWSGDGAREIGRLHRRLHAFLNCGRRVLNGRRCARLAGWLLR